MDRRESRPEVIDRAEVNSFDEYIRAVLAGLPACIARAKLLKIINKNIKSTLPHVGDLVFANDKGLKITQDEIEIPICFTLKIKLGEIDESRKEH